jgi:eukaryotic-like serine/threonine-protein kinase
VSRSPLPFGKYLLLERVSVGGMAEVFKAKHFGVEGFEKIIAIKKILPSMAEDAEFIQMFIDEAKIAGQLSHANVCQIFELGKVGDSHFIAMEYILGKDLLQMLGRLKKLGQPMPFSMACFIIAKLCEGLDYAHRKKDPQGRPLQIIHRDVSPQNVLVSYEGEVKIIDFGIAKAASRSARTQAGVLKGKFGYMSPEQVRGLPLDRRSDLFAIGTLLHEMLTGDRLFAGESDFSILEKVRNVDAPPPSRKRKDIPPELERIVMKALARNVEDRYQWANELQDDLHALLMGSEPVFTAKSLSAWMKSAFERELLKERRELEEYKRVGTGEHELSSDSLLGLSTGSWSESLDRSLVMDGGQDGDDGDEATAIGGPSFLEGKKPKPGNVTHSGFGDEAPTEIYGADGPPTHPDEVSLPGPTNVLGGGQVVQRASGADTLALRKSPLAAVRAAAGPAPAPAQGRSPTQPVPVIRQQVSPPPAVPLHTPPGGSSPQGLPQPGQSRPPLPAPQQTPGIHRSGAGAPIIGTRPVRRSTLARDIAIGAIAALLVTGLVVGIYLAVTRVLSGEAPVQVGSIVVSADRGGEVFVNGSSAGAITDNALTLENIAAGEVEIVVRRAGVKDCVQKGAVDPRRTLVITCAFAGLQKGRLILEIGTPDVTVLVDGAQISAPAAREPQELDPNRTHTVLVKRDGYASEELEIKLAAGETQRRQVVLKQLGTLVIHTSPWARVLVDDKDTGRMTPIDARQPLSLAPGKHHLTFVVGTQRYEREVTVKEGEQVSMDEKLR